MGAEGFILANPYNARFLKSLTHSAVSQWQGHLLSCQVTAKKVMINLVILYRLGKELFEQCDIKSLEFVYQKLVSTRAHKTSCMFLYRYKVTKKINYEFFYGYIEPNWPYTVWNFAKCNSVTFWKFFRIVKFLIKMLI